MPNTTNTFTTLQQTFSLNYSYPVSFSYGLFDPANTVLKDTLCKLEQNKCHKVIIFLDEGVVAGQPALVPQIYEYAAKYKSNFELVADVVLVPGGEKIKSDLSYIEYMHRTISEHHIDRHSFVIGIGGGALLDAVGLVAATAHRGIRHIRVPTTVLAQNDSGVGVKNGINLFGQKNYLGTFAPPYAVLNDYQFIETLPARDKIAGIAEAVKVALIRDILFFHWLESNAAKLTQFESDSMQHMIKRCAEIHMDQIANGGDPFETGSARPLDFGHWIAHRLETITDYEPRHGEAVAIGIAIDARYSVLAGLLQAGADERIHTLLNKLGFNLWHDALEIKHENDWAIMQGLTDFQEHLGGELTITLLADIGVGLEVHEMNQDLVLESIQWIKARHKNTTTLVAQQ